MQVSSQTCSCTEKGRPGEDGCGGLWNKTPESAALPLPPSLSAHTASGEAHRHSTLSQSQALLASLPPLRRDEFVLASTPLCENPTHIKQQWQRAHLIGQLSEWSEQLITTDSFLTVAQAMQKNTLEVC